MSQKVSCPSLKNAGVVSDQIAILPAGQELSSLASIFEQNLPSVSSKTSSINYRRMRSTSCFDKINKVSTVALKTRTFRSKDHLVDHLFQYQKEKLGAMPPEPKITKKGIEQSLLPTSDFYAETSFDEERRKELGLPQEVGLKVSFSRNSSANGCRYWDVIDGVMKKVTVQDAITSSYNRGEQERTSVLRLIENESGQPIAYAGRPSTFPKALELAQAIFFRERETGRGLKLVSGASQKPLYELTFIVQSVVSASPLLAQKEKHVTEEEIQALKLLKEQPISLIDPKTNEEVMVRFNPIFLNEQFNFMNRIEKILPGSLSGEYKAKMFSQEGEIELARLITELSDHHSQKTMIENIFFQYQNDHTLKSEDRICLLAFLSFLLDIPLVDHCMSTTDRTAIMIAITAGVKKWLDEGWPIPLRDGKSYPHLILDDPRFKELFLFYLETGNEIAKVSRGEDGLKWEGGDFLEHPALSRLLPERFVKDFSYADLSGLKKVCLTPFMMILATHHSTVRKQLKTWCSEEKNPLKKGLKIGALGLGALGAVIELPLLLTASSAIGIRGMIKNGKGETEVKEKKRMKFWTGLPALFPQKIIDKKALKAHHKDYLLFKK